MELKTEYPLKQKDAANIVAYMKNGFVYEENGSLQVVERNELNNRILQLTTEQNFIGVNELLKAAKSKSDLSEDTVSKSIRLPFSAFYKLLVLSERKDMSFADVIRKTSVHHLESFLSNLEDTSSISSEKVGQLINLVKKWDSKKASKGCSSGTPHLVYCGTAVKRFYTVSLDKKKTEDFESLLMRYIKMKIKNIFNRNNLTEDIADAYINFYLEKDSYRNTIMGDKRINFIDIFDAVLEPSTISIDTHFTLVYNDIDILDFEDDLYGNIQDKYGEEVFNRFFQVHQSYGIELCSLDVGKFVIVQGEAGIQINNLSLWEDASTLKQEIYSILNSDSFFTSSKGSKTLLEADFDVVEYESKLKEAISMGDYETASNYSESLQKHQILLNLSEFFYDSLVELTRESKVVTFTIPRPLLALLDLAREDITLSKYVAGILESSYEENVIEV